MTTSTLPRIGSPELCYRCDQTVARARTRSGKVIVMDFHPSQLGGFVIVDERDGAAVVAKQARYLGPEDPRPRFTCHWDHCRGRSRARSTPYGRRGLMPSPFGA